jgi:CspA family cold shock protein
LTGTVDEFDADKGFGLIRASDGTSYFFHCTTIVDGSRTIDPGTRVSFDVVAGHHGRWEAAAVSRCP